MFKKVLLLSAALRISFVSVCVHQKMDLYT
jgi:hypothetical protein